MACLGARLTKGHMEVCTHVTSVLGLVTEIFSVMLLHFHTISLMDSQWALSERPKPSQHKDAIEGIPHAGHDVFHDV